MAEKGYVGPSICAGCHLEIYNNYRATAHPFKIRSAKEAQIVGMALPEGFSWEDISYVIGGRRWKIRYMDTQGYIVTRTGENRDIEGKNQYNLATGVWTDYHSGEKKPYDCGPCHTSGYSEEGNQDSLEGIIGTWAFPGITCEDCHMPAASKSAVSVVRWQADVKTHIFKINVDPEAKMFSDEGDWANGYLTLEFSCLKCHLDRSTAWAARYAENAHTIGK